MLLAYVDESGINYQKNRGYWEDGPYAIWTSILITEKKYLDIERCFQDLAKIFLPKDLQENEYHGEIIWSYISQHPNYKSRITQYFEEMLQLNAKLRVPVIFGIQQKNPRIYSKRSIEHELKQARYSLLTLMEHKLSELNETAIIVSDSEGKQEKLKDLVFQRTKWRYSPSTKRITGIRPKYLFEFHSNCILDQLHYVDSKSSLLMQYTDNLCFVLRRALEQLYLVYFPKQGNSQPSADINKVPITENTFNLFLQLCNVSYAFYNQEIKDVELGQFYEPPQIIYKFDRPTQSGSRVLGLPLKTPDQLVLESFTPYK